MQQYVKHNTWYIQEYFMYFVNDSETSQRIEHHFQSKAKDGGPWEQ